MITPARGKTGKNSGDRLQKDYIWSPVRAGAFFVHSGRFLSSGRGDGNQCGSIPSQRLHVRGRDLGPEDPTGSFKEKCRSALG